MQFGCGGNISGKSLHTIVLLWPRLDRGSAVSELVVGVRTKGVNELSRYLMGTFNDLFQPNRQSVSVLQTF